MSVVQVNKEDGGPLTKIAAGETVDVALQRLKHFGIGALEDKTGLALLGTQLITAEGEPYVFKPLQQPQQVGTVPEEYKQLAAFVKEEMDKKTKHKPMSEASVPFAEEILKGYGYHCIVDPPVKESGSRQDPPVYSWKVVDQSSVVWKKGEHGGTPGARDWARTHLLGNNTNYDLKVVTGAPLPSVKANRRSAAGTGDLAIGIAEDMKLGEEYLYANGLVELKTDAYPLKTGQNLLELLALSKISSFGTGVALLATDCNKKWETFHFSDSRTIRRRIYTHGRKALDDFMELIISSANRVWKPLQKVVAEEQNLDGFEFEQNESKKMKATADEAMLERIADHLGYIYGERPLVPLWARAESRVPGYYT